MSGTYYKYAERNVDSQINWAEVGKNVVDMLREEDRLREEKKAALDEASRSFGQTLENAPQGAFKSANEWILGYAEDASQARLMQDRLLKSGLLKVKDYTVMRQNLNDGTNQMFQIAKEYQSKAKEAMDRYQLKESQETEAWLMEQIEGLSNFKDTKAYINPTNFTVSLAGMKKQVIDGKEVMVMETDPNKFVSINQLRNRLDIKLDRYKYVDAITSQVDALGEFQTADIARVKGLYKMLSVREIEDPMKRESFSQEDKKIVNDYFEWEENMIKAELSNSYNQLSILTDAVDKVPGTQDFYTPTFSEEEAKSNPKFILLKDDGSGMIQPVFTEEQNKAATEFLRSQTRNTLDRKINISAQSEPQTDYAPSYVYERGEKGKESADFGNMLGKFYSGNGQEIVAARQWLMGLPGVTFVQRTPTGVTVTKDGVTKDFNFTEQGQTIGFADWVKSTSQFIRGDSEGMNDVLRGAEMGRGGKALNTEFQTRQSARALDLENDYLRAQRVKYPPTAISPSTTEDQAVEFFRNMASSMPGMKDVTVRAYRTGAGQGIVVTKGNKRIMDVSLSAIKSSPQKYINQMIELSRNNATLEEKALIAKQGFNQRESREAELD